MFKKKFSVRVKHYWRNYYVVEYAHYCFFKTWYEITYWHNAFAFNDTSRWIPVLFENYKDAENFAKQFNNYDDLVKHYVPFLEKIDISLKKRNEQIPYEIKIIK